MNEQEFKSGMMFLASLYGPIKDETYKIYWSILKKYSNDHFLKMLEGISSNFRPTSQIPFPLPPDFTDAIGISGSNRAQAAVTAVKNAVEQWGAWSSVDFGDPALHAVINRFGGWPEICSWGNAGKWQFNEKKFMEAYEAAVDCGESAGPVEGNFEIGNRGKNQSDWNKPKKIAYEKAIEPQIMQWIGSDFSRQMEYKNHEPKRINTDIEAIGNILTINEGGKT